MQYSREKFEKREQFYHKWYIFVTNCGGVCSGEMFK